MKMQLQNRNARVALNSLILAFIICLPLEGVLRKWLLNGIQQPLLFIRDPVLFAIYGAYLLKIATERTAIPTWFVLWASIAILAVGLTFLQAANAGLPPVVYAVGLRNYILFVPLMFIIGECLDERGLRAVINTVLIIAVPIAVLVILQFSSPVFSPINKGLDETVKGRFLVAQGVVRPYGPFTFVQAQNYFSIFTLACVLAAVELRQKLGISSPIIILGAVATIIMGALSGSRTFFVSAAILILFYCLPGLVSRDRRKAAARLAIVGASIGAFIIAFTVIFPKAYSTMSERQATAEGSEGSIFARMTSIMTAGVGPAIETAPPLGFGLGAGSNVGTAATGVRSWSLGEYDLPRMINELGPVAGLVAIMIRSGLGLWLLLVAVSAAMRSGNGAALPMAGLALILIVSGQVVGQNQVLSFCWLAMGMTLALSRTATSQSR
ncbi:hypothetical protein ABOZ73_07920 [Caulobacter sp. 73W]|uniref:O-antigen ligase domain-containing protein n=1 Tax=Caulobacter sp. 73W TaxID=3161137 RepID=A0AB39KX23_9CAUL